MRIFKLCLTLLLLTGVTPRAEAGAVIVHLTPGRMALSPFLHRIDTHQSAGFVRFHVSVTETAKGDCFDPDPKFMLSVFKQGIGKGASFISIAPMRSLHVNRHGRTLNCMFEVSMQALKDEGLCFDFEHDARLNTFPHSTFPGPAVEFILASLKDFAPQN